MYRTTFINENQEKNIKETALGYLESRRDELKVLFCNPTIREVYNELSELRKDILEEVKENKLSQEDEFYDIANDDLREKLYTAKAEYGLSFDFIGELEEDEDGEIQWKDDECYYRFQISYGGPTEEVRFHHDGTIEFVYLNWFCGCGIDVTQDEVFQAVKWDFEEIGMIDFQKEYTKELENAY